MKPSDFMLLWIGTDVTFEIYIIPLLDVVRVERTAKMQFHLRRICNTQTTHKYYLVGCGNNGSLQNHNNST